MLSERHQALLEARGLDVELLIRFGVTSHDRFGPDTIEIPYLFAGERQNTKYRTISGELRLAQDDGAKSLFWNQDAICDESLASHPLIIAQDEFAAIAAIQAGFSRVVSVPNGAPISPIGELSGNKYAYLEQMPALGRDIKEIILATDGDQFGIALRDDLARKLGRARCKWISYPKETTDLCAVLARYNERGIVETMARAQWLAIDGVYRLSELPPLNSPQAFDSGFPGLSGHYKLRIGDFCVVTGTPGKGKALALDTPIATPDGWTTMGALSVGDTIFDDLGMPCSVIAATPVMIGNKCFSLRFNDGETLVADADHLWLTESDSARCSRRRATRSRPLAPRGTDQQWKREFPSVVNTVQISETLRIREKWNHQITNAKALVLPAVTLPISPYLLGAWLGDGTTLDGHLTVSDQDAEPMYASMGGRPIKIHRYSKKTPRWSVPGLKVQLRSIGVLGNKHIPLLYSRASIAQRIELLRGLMDTDGYAHPRNGLEFISTNKRLANDVHELICGLGLRVGFSIGRATLNGRDCGPKYRLRFSAPFSVFSIPRKAEKQRNLHAPKRHRCGTRTIIGCDPVKSVPVRCIAVDSPSHLFLSGRAMIPTHNTTFTREIASLMALRYNWRTVMASFEAVPQLDHKRALRTWYNSELVINQSESKLAKADEWIDEHFRFVVAAEDEDITLDWLIERISAAAIRDHAKLAIIDPWNEMDHERGRDETLTEYVGAALRRLKRMARSLGLHLIVAAHPAKMQRNREGKYPTPALYDISDSAMWANRADVGIIVERADNNQSQINIQKVRFHDEIGTPGEITVRFNYQTGSFEALQ